jgi:AraC-like ligand binding domain
VADWSRYWRSAAEPLEAMHAHFQRHVYHRHSHEIYSFGVTEDGVQSFNCRGSARASAAGMIMAFNPDDPHDGQACDELGFTYRIIHVGPELVAGVLADITGRRPRCLCSPTRWSATRCWPASCAPCTGRWPAARPRCAATSCWPRRSLRWWAGPEPVRRPPRVHLGVRAGAR